jgi:molybdopterin-containing oxidoreductase family iron-sulfur binding subunit
LGQLAATLGLRARGDRLFLPHFEGDSEPEGDHAFPFTLGTYKLMSLAGGKGANQPWLQQEPAAHLEVGWDCWVEINPETAGQLGIEDGDPVWLESAKGKVRVTARHFAGTPPRLLHMPYGWGHTAYGRWARNRGKNPNAILEGRIDPATGLPAWSGTRVRLTKA